ncbi:MAG TPA: hypothetical protein VHQ01_10645, partial [Pyrinomonadaceae bacterium]|nr:hypothetical protein [Pyrinomonadaceae bacterium]
EDYGTLYIQWADSIHRAVPNIKLGGPSFQEIEPDSREGKAELGNPVWLERFIHYLDKHDRASDFSFFSFEWYPFDEVCKPTPPQIAQTAKLLSSAIRAFRRHGLKPDVPLVISEYGYSAFATRAEIDIEGAIFNADTVGAFLALGGSQAYLYGYEVNNIEHSYPCTAGNNMLFLGDEKGNIEYRTATYFGTRLMMQEWLQPTGGDHKFYLGTVTTKKDRRNTPIAAYTVLRPDGQSSMMIVNRDSMNAWKVNIRSRNETGQIEDFFKGEVDAYQFSNKEFKWDERLGRPGKSGPPAHTRINADRANDFQLPAYSVTVLRGRTK